jgi:hypothetical protein
MLREELNVVMTAIRARESDEPRLRGRITMDSAYLAAYKADNQLIGSAFSIPVYREADLGDGAWEYHDEAGNHIDGNT